MKGKTYRLLSAAVLFGGLWGISEATLGYLLHLLGRITPIPGLAGFVMFPVGLFFMLAASRAGGGGSAVLLTAVVAAGIKTASAALPSVPWLFVSNPALSILAEGLIVFTGLRLFTLNRDRLLPAKTLALAVGWRILFLLMVFVLPVQKGILMKGTSALLSFLLVESVVNALIITGAAALSARTGMPAHGSGGTGSSLLSVLQRPLPAAAVLVFAVAVQLGVSAL